MKSIEQKRAEAQVRQEAYDKLTLDEKIRRCKGKKQMKKLLKQKEGLK
jgi:hypothetical protein